MEQNQNIIRAVQKWLTVLVFFLIGQILLAMTVNILLWKYATAFGLSTTAVNIFRVILNAIVFLIALIQNFFFLSRIFRTKDLINVNPIKCVVEDFIITTHRHDRKKAYNIYILLKDPTSGKLYFTYGPYSLSFYDYTFSRINHVLTSAHIFRKDGSVVKLGQPVWLYIRRPINVLVQLDKQQIKLNRKKFSYQNINKNIIHQTFLMVNFVEGAVDVEFMQ